VNLVFAQQSLHPKLSRRCYASVSYALQKNTVLHIFFGVMHVARVHKIAAVANAHYLQYFYSTCIYSTCIKSFPTEVDCTSTNKKNNTVYRQYYYCVTVSPKLSYTFSFMYHFCFKTH